MSKKDRDKGTKWREALENWSNGALEYWRDGELLH